MAIAYFPGTIFAEAIDVSFFTLQGGHRTLRLLVDSGFTGESSFVIPLSAVELVHAPAIDKQTSGAITGLQRRVIIACEIPEISFQTITFAIVADPVTLDLPPGVQGLVGLRFLRNFRRWGAERTGDGSWRFFLET